MSPSTILVLGAQGMLGRFTANALRDAGHRVFRGGRRQEIADDFRLVDLDSPATFADALKGVDLVVSSIEDADVRAERYVMRAGGVLLSQASLTSASRKQLAAEAARGAAGTVILNCGFSGVGALAAGDLLARYPTADAIELAYVVSTGGSSGPAGARYAHRLLAGMPKFSTKVLRFSPPRGPRRCFDLSNNGETFLSPTLTGERSVHAYLAVGERSVNAFLVLLGRLGLLRKLPEAVLTAGAARHQAAATLTREPMRARVAVCRRGAILAACGLDAEGDYNSSVQSTMLFSEATLKRAADGALPVGLHCVEDLFTLSAMSDALAAQRIIARPLAA